MDENSGTKDLVEKAGQGDAQAADHLLQLHREPLRRMIAQRLDKALSARVDASDIVQDVLIEAHRRLSDYLRNPIMPFRLWLRQMAMDHIIDAHRKHRLARRRSIDLEKPLSGPGDGGDSSLDLAGQVMSHSPTPASEALRAELKLRLDQAINKLEEGDREIILMRHVEQMSNLEVAGLLGIAEAAASMRYLRAVRKLRQFLVPGGL